MILYTISHLASSCRFGICIQNASQEELQLLEIVYKLFQPGPGSGPAARKDCKQWGVYILEPKVFSNLMDQYNREMDSLFKEYNRIIGNNERLSVSTAQFIALQNFFYMKHLEALSK